MPVVPKKYEYLTREPLPPRMVAEALKTLGVLESPGASDNQVILGWADEVAATCGGAYNKWAADFYNKDSIPWCGLYMAVIAGRAANGRAERFPPRSYLAALAWCNWGEPASEADISVGDVVVLTRKGGGHVFIALAVSDDGGRVMGIGGNQSDAVTIAEFSMKRVYAVRRPPYLARPPGSRRVVLRADGTLSTNEA